MEITIDKKIKQIMQYVLKEGHEIYLVGGTVRDLLLGQNTKDYDFTTSAKPSEIKNIFQQFKIMDYGEEHGTVAVYHRGDVFEITTFRSEGKYSDGRRPDKVEFVNSLEEDLSRRDFTINSLATDISGRIIDLFGGIEDFKNGVIRAVGNPTERFQEDSLRMLRAARFALKLGFEIEANTKDAIKSNSNLIVSHDISGERIFTELNEIFLYTKQAFKQLYILNLIDILFPRIKKLNNIDSLMRTIRDITQNCRIYSWSFILIFSSSQETKENISSTSDKIFSRYPGLSSYKKEYTTHLAINYMIPDDIVSNSNESDLVRWIFQCKKPIDRFTQFNLKQFLKDIIVMNYAIRYDVRNKLQQLQDLIMGSLKRFEQDLPLNGNDIVELGLQGKSIGKLLKIMSLIHTLYPDWKKNKLIELVKNLIFRNFIDTSNIRDIISQKNPSYTDLETNHVIFTLNEITIIKNNEKEHICIGMDPIEFNIFQTKYSIVDKIKFSIIRDPEELIGLEPIENIIVVNDNRKIRSSVGELLNKNSIQ